MNRIVCCLAIILSLTSVFAAVTPVYSNDGKTMTVTVGTGVEDTLGGAIPAAVTNLIKLGEGKLTLTTAAEWPDYAGHLEVRAGTFVVGSNYAYLGTPTSVTVSAGATLDLSGFKQTTRTGTKTYLKTRFYVSGNGYNGAGAIRRTDEDGGNTYSQSLIKYLTLLGDTKLVGGAYTNSAGVANAIGQDHGWGIGQHSGTPYAYFEMNSHNLTIEGGFSIGNSGTSGGSVTIHNPGNINVLDKGRLVIPSVNYLTITGTGAATFPNTMDKSITLGNNAQMMTYMLRNSTTFTYKLVVPEGNTAAYNLLAGDNSQGNVRLPLNVDGTLTITLLGGSRSVYPLHFFAPVTGSGTIKSYSDFSNAFPPCETRIESNNSFSIGELAVTRGPLAFQGAGIVSVTNFYKHSGTLYGTAETVIGSDLSDNRIARINLRGNTHFGGKNGACSDHAIMVGKDKYGILDVSDGATVSNMIYVARRDGDYGAIYLDGDNSELYWPSTANNRSLVGDVGYGAVMMDGGKAILDGNAVLFGRNGGSGYWFQTGGSTLVKQGYLWLGRPNGNWNSTADLHIEGGTLEAQNSIYLLFPDASYSWGGSPRAVVTVGGNTSTALIKTTEIVMFCTTNTSGCTSIINLNTNGTLVADKIYRAAAGLSTMPDYDWTRSRLYINFNGGTLKFKSSQAEFFKEEKTSRYPTRTCIYEGGATFDTGNYNVGYGGALVKPTGQGVVSATMPDDYLSTITGSNKFIGASRLISQHAAFSGITRFNKADRSAKSIIITCPGSGMDSSHYVKFYDLTRNATAVGSFELADLATTGGITKKGAGTLTLKGVNTYGGPTRILEGSITFVKSTGYPGGDLEIPASALASGSAPFVTAKAFALTEGKKIRITGFDPATFRFSDLGRRTLIKTTDAMDPSIVSNLELTSDSGATITSNTLKLTLSPDRKQLSFTQNRGLSILLY